MSDEHALVKTEREGALAQTGQAPEVMGVQEVGRQMKAVHALMKDVMKEGEDYDVIPGTKKPSLLQPGAEKLGVMFRIAPSYERKQVDLPNGHREYESHCTLRNITTGQFLGEAFGLCTTMETRYRWRQQKRVCVHCGVEAIIKGQERYGGGWLCYKKIGGCGAKWPDGDQLIEGQAIGRVENPDVADCYHTVLSIAQKRSYVRAIRNATAASAIFTDSTEELEQEAPPQQEPDRGPDRREKEDPAPWDGPQKGGDEQWKKLAVRLDALGFIHDDQILKLASENDIDRKSLDDLTAADINVLEKAVTRLEEEEDRRSGARR